MDSITDLIKAEIKIQYGSMAKFAETSGITYRLPIRLLVELRHQIWQGIKDVQVFAHSVGG